jgi:hypothetical protein
MDNPIKRKRKERWKIVEENEDGSYTKERTNRRGDIIRKKIKPAQKQKYTPEEEPKEKEPKEKKTREQRKYEKDLQERVAAEYPIFKTKEEKKETKRNIKEFDRDRKRREKERKQKEREVIRAERGKNKKKKTFKGKPKKGRYKGKGGGDSSPTCKEGLFGKFRKKCKLNV